MIRGRLLEAPFLREDPGWIVSVKRIIEGEPELMKDWFDQHSDMMPGKPYAELEWTGQ